MKMCFVFTHRKVKTHFDIPKDRLVLQQPAALHLDGRNNMHLKRTLKKNTEVLTEPKKRNISKVRPFCT